jgi:outer membrane receptor protein involved in Fe transport
MFILWTALLVAVAVLIPGRTARSQDDAVDVVPPPPPPPKDDRPSERPRPGDGRAPLPRERERQAEAPPKADAPDIDRPDTGIVGRLVDADSGRGIIEGQVHVVGRDARTITDLQGHFALELPPGRYDLRSFYEFYQPARVQDVRVRPGEVTEVTIELEPESGDAYAEEVVVTARANTATEATQLQIRKESGSVRDAISAEEISKTGDSTASGAARRVVSATVLSSGYLVVRGLGGRYTNTLLNGMPLPNTDPDRPGVQLDIFPSGLLSSLAVEKTFTPDMLGNFSGGSLNVVTRDYPDDFTLNVSMSLGFNSLTTFHGRPSYDGGNLDWLGFDDGTRALPGEVPDERVLFFPRENDFTQQDIERIAESFPNTWNLERKTSLPSIGLGLTVGDQMSVGGDKLGYLVSFGYGYSPGRKRGVSREVRFTEDRQTLESTTDLDLDTGQLEILWGGLGTLSYAPTDDTDISLVALWNQNATDTTQHVEGLTRASDGGRIEEWRFEYVERSLFSAQLLGEHRDLDFPPDATLNWKLFTSLARRDEPNTRGIRYRDRSPEDDDDSFILENKQNSAQRLFSHLEQLDLGGSTELTLPIGEAELSVGGLAQTSDRDFQARRFRLRFSPGNDPDIRQQPAGALRPESILTDQNIGTAYRFEEKTEPTDSYQANQNLFAAFAMVDTPVVGDLRFVGGVRAEAFQQEIVSKSPFAADEDQEPQRTDRTDVDALPSASLVYELTEDMFLRGAYSMTVARPQVRELAPFRFTDFVRRRNITGNPDLDRTRIHNLDLRWELFPGDTEVVAVSAFYKKFLDPIERIILQPTSLDAHYENTAGARNFGAEVEARLGLDRLWERLEGLSVGGNVAVIRSQIELTEEQARVVTNRKRPLAGQSPYVANLSLGFSPPDAGFSLFVYYNVFGSRITDVGVRGSTDTEGKPDVKEQPFHSLDVNARLQLTERFTLRLSAKNLLFDQREFKQGGIVIQSIDPGTSVGIGLGYSY